MDFFHPYLGKNDLNSVSNLALAHIGDAVYELMVRTHILTSGTTTAGKMHRSAVMLVSAPAQAAAAEKLQPDLTEEEREIFRRGRNAHVNSVPHASTETQYHAATALEALFGYLYLDGRHDRLNELFSKILED